VCYVNVCDSNHAMQAISEIYTRFFKQGAKRRNPLSHSRSRRRLTAPIRPRKSQRRSGSVTNRRLWWTPRNRITWELRRFAGPVRSETSGRRPLPVIAQTLPPREGGLNSKVTPGLRKKAF